MSLRIYAIVVTVLLLAALTNPSAQKHYAELERIYPWVKDSLLEAAKNEVWRRTSPPDQDKAPLYNGVGGAPPYLPYTSFGAFSFVHTVERWEPCLTYSGPDMPISVGLFGCVFATRPSTVLARKGEERSAKQ